MKTQSVTETFERFIALETQSMARLEEMRNDVRRVRLALEAEIEATNRLLAELEEL
ncbi:MAG: hypothetical protein ACO38Q_07685 [Aquiluna sp.]